MKHNTILIHTLFFIAVLSISCTDKMDSPKDEKEYMQHEVILNGFRITFTLPDYFEISEDCYKIARKASSGCYLDTLICFCSTNDEDTINNFQIITALSDFKESEIDSYFKEEFNFYTTQNMVPFYEKKRDKNGHVYYLTMMSKVEKFPQAPPFILSRFSYYTIFKDRYFICVLNQIETVDNDFSYEEKRKMIESVQIEKTSDSQLKTSK